MINLVVLHSNPTADLGLFCVEFACPVFQEIAEHTHMALHFPSAFWCR